MGDVRAEQEFTELVSARGAALGRRGRVVAIGAAFALVVALGAIATAIEGGTTRVFPAALVTQTPAVPDTIYAVPERLLQFPDGGTHAVTWAPALDAGTDLAVGRAAAGLAVGASRGPRPLVGGFLDRVPTT